MMTHRLTISHFCPFCLRVQLSPREFAMNTWMKPALCFTSEMLRWLWMMSKEHKNYQTLIHCLKPFSSRTLFQDKTNTSLPRLFAEQLEKEKNQGLLLLWLEAQGTHCYLSKRSASEKDGALGGGCLREGAKKALRSTWLNVYQELHSGCILATSIASKHFPFTIKRPFPYPDILWAQHCCSAVVPGRRTAVWFDHG